MKNSLKLLLVPLALLSACVKPQPPAPPVEGHYLSVTGTFAETFTKSTLDPSGAGVWSPGDALNVFYGNIGSGKFSAAITEASPSAAFTSTIYVTGDDPSGITVVGVYPYDPSNKLEGDAVTVTLPAIQTAVAGSFANGAAPAVAKSNSPMLSFRYVAGAVAFSVVHEGITSIIFKGNDGELLAGTASCTVSDTPAAGPVSSGSEEITLVAPSTDGFTVGQIYYATLYPQTLSNGFTVTYRKGSAHAEYVDYNSARISRNAALTLAGKDAGLTFMENDGSPVFDENRIVASFGVCSDTHIDGTTTMPANKFKAAMQQMRDKAAENDEDGIDGVLISGDLNNDPCYNASYYSIETAALKTLYESVYDPAKVPMIYTVGNHDTYQWWTSRTLQEAQNISNVLGDKYFLFDLDNDARKTYECRDCLVDGYHILCITPTGASPVIYDSWTVSWLDNKLAELTTAEPEKYVIVLTHPMIYNTTYGSLLGNYWATEALTSVLSKYPQVMTYSGHLHFPLNDPRSVWQGDFTAFGCGSVRYMAIESGGYEDMSSATVMKDANEFSQGLVLQFDVNGNARVTRMDFYNQTTIGEPWTISYPVKNKTHLQAYSHVLRKAANTAPKLSSLVIDVPETAVSSVPFIVKFAAGTDDEFVHHYVVTLLKGGSVVSTKKYLADFYRHGLPKDMKPEWTVNFGNQPTGTYTVEVTAYDSWDAKSETLSKTITIDRPSSADAVLYADIDFDGASVTDSKDKLKFTNKDATIGPATVTSGGKDYSVPALHAYTDKYVIGEFKELASASDFKTWAGSGFCMEAFFVDKTASKSVHGIMCGTQSGGWGLAVRASGKPYFIVGEGSSANTNSYKYKDASAVASNTELTHFVGVYDPGSQKLRIYVNGVLDGESSVTGEFLPGISDTFNKFCLGDDIVIGGEGGDYPCVDMVIVDAKIWKGVMTGEDVAAAYQNALKLLK